MKVPVWIASTLFAAIIALQAWQLSRIDQLSQDVAAIKATLQAQSVAQFQVVK